jgi:DNA invertase Pin-like site-specific DNA recombinase
MKKRGPRKKTYIHKIAESTVKWKKRKDGEPMMIGYARVSMSDQNNQRQIDSMIEYGVAPEDIFQDKASGKTVDRPAWQACFRDLQKGDILVIYSLDRLGRKLSDLISIEQSLFDKGVKLKVLSQPIDTSYSGGRMLFHIIGSLAQWERENNWERTQHGLDQAKARGVVGGQASNFSDEVIRNALEKSKGSERGAAKIVGCRPITIRRRKAMWAKGKKLFHAIKPKRKARAA